MDARSIAATARNHGVLTSAADVDYTPPAPVQRRFDRAVYDLSLIHILLVMGYLPTEAELKRFKDIMSQARKLPEGFTEGMIMRHPSGNMMNELARSVLSLYSYDASADDTSIENLLLQSVKLIGCFPSIVANSYAVKRHYFCLLYTSRCV